MTDQSYDTTAFAAGLLNPSLSKPDLVTGPGGSKAEKRYNVYRNNVTVSLINSVADIFPAIFKIVGEDNFRLMAREYVRAHPPSSPLLFLYGKDFAEFIEAFPAASHLPYLPDVARLERAWLTAYHAADLAALDPAKLGAVPPERLEEMTFKMHPATAIIKSKFPIQDIFLMNRGFMEIAPVQLDKAQAVMLTRPETETRIIELDDGDEAFLSSIADGFSLGESALRAPSTSESFDLNSALQILLATGATTHIIIDEKEV